MNIGQTIMLIGILVLVVGAAWMVGAQEENALGSPDERYKVQCSGTVEVDAFGVGTPELDPLPQCRVEQCGRFGLVVQPLAWASEGNVQLVITDDNGQPRIVDKAGYESTFGGNTDFKLSSACTPLPITGSIDLLEDGIMVDSYEVRFE